MPPPTLCNKVQWAAPHGRRSSLESTVGVLLHFLTGVRVAFVGKQSYSNITL